MNHIFIKIFLQSHYLVRTLKTSGIHAIKLFLPSNTMAQSKLERLSLENFLHISLIFVTTAMTLHGVGHRELLHLGWIQPSSQILDYNEYYGVEKTI
jgi:hypothetical protein